MKRLRWIALIALAFACNSAPPPVVGRPPPAPPPVAPVIKPAEGWRSQKPTTGAPGQLNYPAAEVAELANKMKVYFVRRPGGMTTMAIIARGGGSAVGEGQSGLAALTVRLMTEGTKSRTSLQLAKDVEALGSSLEHDAGRDYVRIGLTTLGEDFDRGLTILADVVQNPAFLETEITRVKGEWLDSLEAERQEPMRLATLAGLRLLLGPVTGAPVRGSKTDVKKLGRRDFARFHKEQFTPANMALAVVGDAPFDLIRQSAERVFGATKGAAPSATKKVAAPPTNAKLRVVVVDRPDAVQSAVFAAQLMPARLAPGFEARQLMNDVLGGLFTSRLNMNLRETHAYTYGVRSSVVATRNWGAWIMSTALRTDATADGIAEALTEIATTKDPARGRPIAEPELGRGRADLIQALAADLQDTGSVVDDLETLFVYDLPADYHARYPILVKEMDGGAVQSEAARLVPEALTIVVVGDRAKIEPALKTKGWPVEIAPPALVD